MIPTGRRLKNGIPSQRGTIVPETPGAASASRLAFWGIVAFSCAQLGFLSVGCDWDLCGDEAEFWAWSRRLDWSYFARGPLIALVIRLGTELAGGVSLALSGSLMPAVRLPGVLLSALTAWGVFRLGAETCRSPRVGLFAVLILPAVPLFRLGGLLMTCDTPLLCCWTWAAVWSYRGIVRDDLRAWLAAGLMTALGVAAKYTMLAFPASVGLYLLLSRANRRQLAGSGFWMMSLGCVVGMAPIVYWNADHGWVAAGQMSDRLGLTSTWNWGRIQPLLAFLGGELVALGFWWVFGLPALWNAVFLNSSSPLGMWASRPRLAQDGRGRPSHTFPLRASNNSLSAPYEGGAGGVAFFGSETPKAPPPDPPFVRGGVLLDALTPGDRPDVLYLFCLWAVVWSACVGVSLLGETEANWSAPAHVAITVLMGWWLSPRITLPGEAGSARRWSAPTVAFWLISLVVLTGLQHSEWFYPLVARFIPAPTEDWPAPMRSIDPTSRLRGYRELARQVEERVQQVRETEGREPFLLTPTYTLASPLSFYRRGRPEAYCLSWSPGMAALALNQHDVWRPNPRHDVGLFRGRTAVVVEDAARPSSYARGLVEHGLFRRAGTPTRVVVRRGALVVGTWDVTVCHDYLGPRHPEEMRRLLATFASAGYFAAQGGTAQGFVQGLYRDMLHRPALPDEVAFWASVLAHQPRALIVAQIAASTDPRFQPPRD